MRWAIQKYRLVYKRLTQRQVFARRRSTPVEARAAARSGSVSTSLPAGEILDRRRPLSSSRS